MTYLHFFFPPPFSSGFIIFLPPSRSHLLALRSRQKHDFLRTQREADSVALGLPPDLEALPVSRISEGGSSPGWGLFCDSEPHSELFNTVTCDSVPPNQWEAVSGGRPELQNQNQNGKVGLGETQRLREPFCLMMGGYSAQSTFLVVISPFISWD